MADVSMLLFVDDPFTDQEHSDFDALIVRSPNFPEVQTMLSLGDKWKEIAYKIIIGLVVAYSNGKLNQQFSQIEDASKVVTSHISDETFNTLMQTALQQKQFKDIRRLVLQRPESRPTSVGSEPKSQYEGVDAVVLNEAFNAPYKGTAVGRLLKAIDCWNVEYNPEIHYGRVIVILQSSGTGKSRLVEELSYKEPLVSVCLRSDLKATTDWPPGDLAATQFFKSVTAQREFYGEEMAAAFLGALMEIVETTLDDSPARDHTGKVFSGWSYGIDDNPEAQSRATLFERVSVRATGMLKQNSQRLRDERAWISQVEAILQFGSLLEDQSIRSPMHPPTWHKFLFETFCESSFMSLAEKLKRLGRNKFCLALDECSLLDVLPTQNGLPLKKLTWSALQRILKASDKFSFPVTFWFLLLDTNPAAWLLAPSEPRPSSFRLIGDYEFIPPFMYLGFNQMAPRRDLTLSVARDALCIEHLKRYGRPYWATLPTDDVIGIANEKLFWTPGCPPHKASFDAGNIKHVFSAFAFRVQLDLGTSEAATRLEAVAVNHHMRKLRSITKNVSVTCAPPEPVLAIAAAKALNEGQNYVHAWTLLISQLILHDTVVDRGGQGELCTRLLLTLARDRATIQAHKSFVTKDSLRIHAIELKLFLQTLLGERFRISEKNPVVDELLQFAEGKYVNFTHFMILEKQFHELTERDLIRAWSTGAAIQCAHGQPVIDGMIVYYSGSLNKEFDPGLLNILPWQTKAKEEAAPTPLGNGLTGPHIVRDGVREKPETIVLLMDLCATSKFAGSADKTQLTRRQARPARTKWSGYADSDHGETEPNNLFLNIRGRSSAQYPVLLPHLHDLFGLLFDHTLGVYLPSEIQVMKKFDDQLNNPLDLDDVDDDTSEVDSRPAKRSKT